MYYALIGLLVNITVITGFIIWALRVREEIGYQVYDKLREGVPRYSSWIFVFWLVPYMGVWSAIVSTYRWNKIDADTLIERLDIFMHRPPGFISKHFLLKDNTKTSEDAEGYNDRAYRRKGDK